MNDIHRNTVFKQYPTVAALLRAPTKDVEGAVLRHIIEYCQDQMHRMVGCNSISTGLFGFGGYAYTQQDRSEVERVINRAWKSLEDAGFIEAPDSTNGRNGYRVPSAEGLKANAATDFLAASMRSMFTRDMFHPSLPDASWHAFMAGDYDTAVFEAFKSVEVAIRRKAKFAESDFGTALMEKAFDPTGGPLTDHAASSSRKKRRLELFSGAFGEIRNPKAHSDPTITDTLVAVEELMTAGMLRRIIDVT